MEGTALQMLWEIQHVPSTPPSPTSCSTSPKYLLIFIYILCPRCPAPVRPHLPAPFPPASSPPPPSNLEPGVVCGWQQPPPGPQSVGGGEASGLVALGRAEVGGPGDRAACQHTPACPQSGNTLATPFASQGPLKGTDGCQMPGAPSPREDLGGEEEESWDRLDNKGDSGVPGLLGGYSCASRPPWSSLAPADQEKNDFPLHSQPHLYPLLLFLSFANNSYQAPTMCQSLSLVLKIYQ